MFGVDRIATCGAVLACCAAVSLSAETPPKANPPDTGSNVIEYRKVLAPADREEEWRPVGVPRYIPMDPDDFEQKVAQANAASQPVAGGAGACIVAARYEAHLEGETLAEGRALLNVRHTIGRATLMPLEPCGLCLADASWADRDGETARLGLGPDGRTAVLVEASGTLELHWSLAGRRDALGAIDFDFLQLPPSPASEIVLELPPGLVPRVDRGIVAADVPSDGPTRRWSIRLEGDNRARLRIAPAGDPMGHGKLTEVHETTVYEVREDGIEITGRFLLDVLNQPLEQLALLLDPHVRLVAAKLDERDLTWSMAASEGDGTVQRAVLQMPQPLEGFSREVRVRAFAPIGPAGVWPLPRIRSQGLFWEGADATLRVRRPLVMEDFVVEGGRQSGMGPLPAPAEGESIRIQFFQPDATVRVALARENVPLELDYGVKVELSAGQVTGRFVGRFRVAQGERFRLEADVARQWVVDSVEADPAGAIGDWRIERRKPKGRKLVVELATPLSPHRPIQLAVVGRRLQSPVGRAQKAAELAPVRFRQTRAKRRLMAVDTVEPYQLVLTGEERVHRREPQSLDVEDLKLFAQPPRGLIFDDDQRVGDLAIALAARKPAFSANVRVEAGVSPAALSETYWVRVVPQSARLGSVVVELAGRPDAPIHWYLGSSDEAVRLGGDDDVADASDDAGDDAKDDASDDAGDDATAEQEAGGEPSTPRQRWEIRLTPSRSEPFEFHAARSGPPHQRMSIGLMQLPDAAQQQGTVEIHALGPQTPRIENRRLIRLLDESNVRGGPEIAPARFRYDPAQDVGGPDSLAVSFSPGEEPACPAASIWDAEVTSRYEPSGWGRHVAVWRLQNAGLRSLGVTLPGRADLDHVEAVWVDGVRSSWRAAAGDAKNRLAVELDPRRGFCTILLAYTTTARRWAFTETLSAALPRPDVPVLEQKWTVWLPPGWKGLARGESQSAAVSAGDWFGRFFGPLGRLRRQRPWDPFRPADWSVGQETATSIHKARRLLEQFGRLAAEGSAPAGGQTRTWGWLVANPAVKTILADAAQGERKTTLLVDVAALGREGIQPDGRLATGAEDSPLARGAALLGRANLALLVADQAMVLTSARQAALERNDVSPLGLNVLWEITSGRLALRVGGASAAGQSAGLVDADRWAAFPAGSTEPWQRRLVGGYLPSDMTGWTARQVRAVAGEPLQIRVVDEGLLGSLGWITLVVSTCIVWWLAQRRSLVAILLVPATAVAAMVVGKVLGPVATGAFLGTLCGWGFRLLSHRPAPVRAVVRRIVSQDTAEAATGQVLTLLVALGAAGLFSSIAVGGEPPPARPLVFVPVDHFGQPSGDEYYVDEHFYSELQRRAAALTGRPQGWLIDAATYRAVLSWQAPPDRLAVTQLRAVFDLAVFGATQRVRIPLAVGDDPWYPVSVRRNGQEVDPVWEKESGLAVEVDPTDWCRLEVTLRPRETGQVVSSGFDLAIPRVATSRLELEVPPEVPKIEVPSARGSTARYDDPSRLVTALGPVDHLSVRWPEEAVRGGTARQDRIDELLWLKVERGYVLVEAMLQMEARRGQATELALEVDPRLQQQGPPRVEGARLEQVKTNGEHPSRLRLKLAEPSADVVRVRLQFLLQGASGIGNVRLPYVHVTGHPLKKHWVGISVDPELEYVVHGAEQTPVVSSAEFSQAWGDSRSALVAAYALNDVSPTWSLATRPRDPKTVIDWALALGVAWKQTRLCLDADVSTTQGYVFQHRIAAPQGMQVEEVSVVADGSQRVLRWSQTPDGTLVAYFNAPIEGEHTLSVRGTLPRLDQPGSPLPLLRLIGAEEHSGVVKIYRDQDARFSLDDVTGLSEVGAPVGRPSDRGLGRLQHQFIATRTEPVGATLHVQPNRPDVRVDQITSLERKGATWTARADFTLTVTRGVIDELQLELPPCWRGPFEMDPSMETQWRDQQQGLLVVKPRSAIEGQWQLSVTGPLKWGPGDPVTVPVVRLKPGQPGRHRIVLPKQAEFQPISWETQGLRKTPLPESFAQRPGAREAYQAYLVWETPFKAVPRSTANEALVHLADVRLALDPGGACHGVATFDLEAAGKRRALLEMPRGWEPVRVMLSGVASCAVAGGDATWQVPLGTTRLPQRVEVVFRGNLPAGAESRPLSVALPTLTNFPVRRTILTLVGIGGRETVEVAGAQRLSAIEQAMIRLRNVAGLIELGKEATSDEAREAVGWYRCWLCRWAAARARAERELAAVGAEAPRAAVAEIDSLAAQQETLAQRQGAEDLWTELAAQPATTVDAGALWQQSAGDGAEARRFSIEGKPDPLRFRRTAPSPPPQAGPMWIGLAAGLGLWVAIWVAAVTGWLARWPTVAGALAGLAWWLWLWPSPLGFVFLLLSVLVSLRFGWRGDRGAGSGVVRLRVSDA